MLPQGIAPCEIRLSDGRLTIWLQERNKTRICIFCLRPSIGLVDGITIKLGRHIFQRYYVWLFGPRQERPRDLRYSGRRNLLAACAVLPDVPPLGIAPRHRSSQDRVLLLNYGGKYSGPRKGLPF